MKAALESALNHPRTERIVLAVILVNALTLGLETSHDMVARFGPLLHWLDVAVLTIFCGEILAKLYVRGLRFFHDAWNVFDFVVVGIALIPASGPLTVLRALRILRVLWLVTVMPSLKRVVGALLGAIPGMSSIVMLLALIFHVGGVMATMQSEIDADREAAVTKAMTKSEEPLLAEVRALRSELAQLAATINPRRDQPRK